MRAAAAAAATSASPPPRRTLLNQQQAGGPVAVDGVVHSSRVVCQVRLADRSPTTEQYSIGQGVLIRTPSGKQQLGIIEQIRSVNGTPTLHIGRWCVPAAAVAPPGEPLLPREYILSTADDPPPFTAAVSLLDDIQPCTIHDTVEAYSAEQEEPATGVTCLVRQEYVETPGKEEWTIRSPSSLAAYRRQITNELEALRKQSTKDAMQRASNTAASAAVESQPFFAYPHSDASGRITHLRFDRFYQTSTSQRQFNSIKCCFRGSDEELTYRVGHGVFVRTPEGTELVGVIGNIVSSVTTLRDLRLLVTQWCALPSDIEVSSKGAACEAHERILVVGGPLAEKVKEVDVAHNQPRSCLLYHTAEEMSAASLDPSTPAFLVKQRAHYNGATSSYEIRSFTKFPGLELRKRYDELYQKWTAGAKITSVSLSEAVSFAAAASSSSPPAAAAAAAASSPAASLAYVQPAAAAAAASSSQPPRAAASATNPPAASSSSPHAATTAKQTPAAAPKPLVPAAPRPLSDAIAIIKPPLAAAVSARPGPSFQLGPVRVRGSALDHTSTHYDSFTLDGHTYALGWFARTSNGTVCRISDIWEGRPGSVQIQYQRLLHWNAIKGWLKHLPAPHENERFYNRYAEKPWEAMLTVSPVGLKLQPAEVVSEAEFLRRTSEKENMKRVYFVRSEWLPRIMKLDAFDPSILLARPGAAGKPLLLASSAAASVSPPKPPSSALLSPLDTWLTPLLPENTSAAAAAVPMEIDSIASSKPVLPPTSSSAPSSIKLPLESTSIFASKPSLPPSPISALRNELAEVKRLLRDAEEKVALLTKQNKRLQSEKNLLQRDFLSLQTAQSSITSSVIQSAAAETTAATAERERAERRAEEARLLLVKVKEEKLDVTESYLAAQSRVRRVETAKRKAESDLEEQKEHHEQRLAQHQAAQEQLAAEKARLAEQLEDQKLTCCVCLDEAPVFLYHPCGHVATCAACDKGLPKRECPRCQEKIRTKHKFFL